MALNQFMHPRNFYKDNPPDFRELAKLYPGFKEHVHFTKSGKAVVDFRKPEVVRTLSICLLDRDFNLKVALPMDRLAPTIPLRLNYLLWVEDLISCVAARDRITLLDIGCGSSCIYPLLGCRLNEKLFFIATDINEKNLSFAKRNVKSNELDNRIQVVQVEEGSSLLGDLQFDICICNPPFYLTDDEAAASSNRPTANSSCSASKCEAVGGDYVFAKRIFEESLRKREEKLWYTIMLGKKSSFVQLKSLLRNPDVETTTFTEFCQGRTMRWGAAWSYHKIDVASVIKSKPARSKRKKNPFKFTSKYTSVAETLEAATTLLHSLDVDFSQNDLTFSLKGDLCANLPNRNERRKKKHATELGPPCKKLKVINNPTDIDFKCDLKIDPVPFGPAQLQLLGATDGFPDMLNRFYLHIRGHL